MAPNHSARLNPPIWRHDAYTLHLLAKAISSKARSILSTLREAPNIVDLGAGTAPYRSIFEKYNSNYIACDIDTGENEDNLVITPGEQIDIQDSFADVVASFQVLEHVWDIDWYLAEARRLLRTDGRLLLSTHGTWLHHPHPTDFRRWTRDGLITEIESRGFIIESITPLVGPLAWTTQFRALGYHYLLSKIPILGPSISAILCMAMYLRMTIEDKITPRDWISNNAAVYILTARKSPTPRSER